MGWRWHTALCLAFFLISAPQSQAFAEEIGMRAGGQLVQRTSPEGDGGRFRDRGGSEDRDGGRSRDRDIPSDRDGGRSRERVVPDERDAGRYRERGGFEGGSRGAAPPQEGRSINRFWGGPYWGYGARFGHPCRWCQSNCGDGEQDEARCRRCESRCGF